MKSWEQGYLVSCLEQTRRDKISACMRARLSWGNSNSHHQLQLKYCICNQGKGGAMSMHVHFHKTIPEPEHQMY